MKNGDRTLQPPQIFTFIPLNFTCDVLSSRLPVVLSQKGNIPLLMLECACVCVRASFAKQYIEQRSQIYACGCLSLGISVSRFRFLSSSSTEPFSFQVYKISV